MNKSLLTTIISAVFIPLGFLDTPIREQLLSIGLFAVSGAITNWLAVYMLFEKVPGLYGSGVIPSRFEDFKSGIRNLIMGQFFTRENIERMLEEEFQSQPAINTEKIVNNINYDQVFQSIVEVILASKYGGMLRMIGGEKALEPLKEPVEEKMRVTVAEILDSDVVKSTIEASVHPDKMAEDIMQKIESIVTLRLNELTPQKVKEIIQEMIREHLGWLVVWGGVFGGVIGLACSFLP
ncbi:MAG: DUF445 family protein [Planctomycetota bacterium]|nr:DUF445 family protein [Planctomycetota bacterium]MDA1142959.1 DUF445 family protein [Planctomycetota bacterium]